MLIMAQWESTINIFSKYFRKVTGYIDWDISAKKNKNRLLSNPNLRIETKEEDDEEEYEEENNKKKKHKQKFSPRNNAIKFTLYTDRKGILETNPSAYLPTINPTYTSEKTDPNNHNTFGRNLKGGINFKRNMGRDKELKLYNNNPSSFDYSPKSPKYEEFNKYGGIDYDYKKKKYKLMKLLKNYECRSEYQIVNI